MPRVPAPDPRFTMANERTFLAWNRTALALIGGGLAVEQFLDTGRIARLALAIPLILLGALVAASSYGRWRANEQAMERGEPLRPSRMPTVIASCFALLSLGALVLGLVRRQISKRITARMALVAGLLALILGAAFVLLVVAVGGQRDAAKLALRSQEAITAGTELEKTVISLENGLRGYVASGREQQL